MLLASNQDELPRSDASNQTLGVIQNPVASLAGDHAALLDDLNGLDGQLHAAHLASADFRHFAHANATLVVSNGVVPDQHSRVDNFGSLRPLGAKAGKLGLQALLLFHNSLLVIAQLGLLGVQLLLDRLTPLGGSRNEFVKLQNSRIKLAALPAKHILLFLKGFDFTRIDDLAAVQILVDLLDLVVEAFLLQLEVGEFAGKSLHSSGIVLLFQSL